MRDRGPMTDLEAADRYLRIVAWARKRYCFQWRDERNRLWTYALPPGKCTALIRIEEAAWNRYMHPALCRTSSTGGEGDARP